MKPWMRWLLWAVLVLGVIFGVFRYFFIDFYTVPDDPSLPINWANAPNLEPGDVVVVWRSGKPHAGDIVQCWDPVNPGTIVVARVLGLPGDKIDITDNTFRVNGFRVPTTGCASAPRKVKDVDGTDVELPCATEEIGGSKHEILVKEYVTMGEVRVAAGNFFLLSDNRQTPWAYDSRTSELGVSGQVPEDWCKRRFVMRLWSKKGWGDSERRMGFLF